MRATFAFLASAFLAVACAAPTEGADGDDAMASEDEIVTGGMRARLNDACTAKLVFLQKDAYKSTAGRSSEMWPPHTTTQLEVTCQTSRGEQRIAPFKENYGTKPGAKDAEGNEILVSIPMDENVVTVSAPWREMRGLVSSYTGCGCDPSKFLSMDAIDGNAKSIVEKLTPILSCPDGTDALLLALKEKRMEDVKRMAAACTINDGVSPAELAKAVAAVEADVEQTLAEHHVCNNNAMLQADLFARFRDQRDASACSAESALCFGPKLFFNPQKEVR